ncbi:MULTISPECIES: general secretion pathway protein GspD [Fusobacterium]|jgi:general secretion pathway protein D|uniref:general secretion pathway protein GspD n=1 Tax=Fusobacterium TaxID=848 RepID=UPI000E96699B|nr:MULTISPECIES: general secretion pathway protein GspD [Fusobacterium]HBJ78640.1 general secretion pathway protein GspD [Fusobacterium sp.]
MKKTLILLLIFFICYNIYGKIEKKSLREIKLEQELELKNIVLSDALAVISKESRISIIADDKAKDIVLDLFFAKGENFENILDGIATTNNLKISTISEMLILSKRNSNISGEMALGGKVLIDGYDNGIEGVKITVQKSSSSPVYTTYGGNFVINDLNPGIYVVKFEKAGFLTVGQIINIDKSINTITVSMERDKNNSEKVKEEKDINNIMEKTFINGEEFYTEKIKLMNISSDDVSNILKNSFGEEVRISSIPKMNIVIIVGKKDSTMSAIKLVKELDKEIQQVRITSQILDVTDNLFETLGFDWLYNNVGSVEKNSGLDISLIGKAALDSAGVSFGSGINLVRQFNNGNDVLGLGINLLQATQDLVISAMPSILVADGEEGEFKITEEVIVGEEKKENDNTEKTTYTPLFREAGIILKVKPLIKENGTIFLKVMIEVSNFRLKKNEKENMISEGGTYNSEGGSKIGRSIETTVKMRDGETIFIGGLKRAVIQNLDSQVPFLGTLPVINIFFKNQSVKKEITDIYIKLKVDIEKDTWEKDSFDKIELHQKIKDIKNRKIYPVF